MARKKTPPLPKAPVVHHGWIPWFLLGVIFLGAVLIRWRMLDFPLERDEGEYAYMGQLILKGIWPYAMHGTQKFPGVYYVAAAMMALFGETSWSLHLGLLLVNLASAVFVFFLARRLFSMAGAVASTGAFALLSMSPTVLGFAAHMTHFAMLPVLAGMVFLWRAVDSGKTTALAIAGACLGLAIVMRQTSLLFVAFGGAFWLAASWTKLSLRALAARLSLFALGAAAPVALLCLHLKWCGVFPQFWESTITYALAYGSEVKLAEGVQIFLSSTQAVIGSNVFFWLGAAAGLVLAAWERSLRTLFLVGFLVTSFVVMCPGLYFRQHYYVQILPVIALFFGFAIARLWERVTTLQSRVAMAVPVVACTVFYPIFAQSDILLRKSPNDAIRSIYGPNPFPEAIEIARHIRENSAPTDTVAILGSEPEIFFYAQRRSATSLIFTYPLLEYHRLARPMQDQMIREIEQNDPEYIVFVSVPASWLARPGSDLHIFRWAGDYLTQHYEVVGAADIFEHSTNYVWQQNATNHIPKSGDFVALYRRKRLATPLSAARPPPP